MTPTYSIVVPAYRSDSTLRELVDRILTVMRDQVHATVEIIIVNDGSPGPATWATLRELAGEHPEVRAINLTRNFGKAAAIICGLARARGDRIITMDDDLQHRPEDIPALVAAGEHDVVMAGFVKREHGLIARITSRIKAAFDRTILGIPVRNSPFRMIKRQIVDAMVATGSAQPFIPALIASVTTDVVTVEVDHAPSGIAGSRYDLRRRVRQFMNLLIGNSTLTLRFIGGLGVIAAALGLVAASLLVVRVLVFGAEPPSGWTSLMVTVLILNGLVLVSTALSGEYFIRLLNNTSRKPVYLVREELGAGDEDEVRT